ncbi:hypothetical protein G7L40_00370 [Paenibacillus polymyxa]|uniref:Uncharacterized protein n=1 Tax=Paenibacillus polymyxa TaxID=1406 RepID=A0A378XXM4_PAEPO|nr:hypothetical protein [Paenibacillus polymyxa]MBE7897164.1 hypothetical protein [Paenibacillus polymyxa]MBG9763021.1 hypothetical protein [Paenibacillus polymyxa]MCC3257587.1 hypothetical protein [Paenibacillus polymyxa]QPK51330.1 hypothetical protein G7035_00370 [Paenibacillus polymyxa]QPK56420.1 hypothetical protein G7L40_00370 [Paenibacillus polymyxa]
MSILNLLFRKRIKQIETRAYTQGVQEGIYKGIELMRKANEGVFVPSPFGGGYTKYLCSDGNLRRYRDKMLYETNNKKIYSKEYFDMLNDNFTKIKIHNKKDE